MIWHFNAYALALFISALITGVVAVYAWRNRAALGPWPAMALLGTIVWSLGYAVATGVHDMAGRIFWAKVQHIGIAILPVSIVAVVWHYTGRARWLTWWRLALVAFVPFVGLVLAWTNEAHGLIWVQTKLEIVGSLALLDISYGPYFWFYAAYNHIVLLSCVFLFLQTAVRSSGLRRRQAIILLVGMLFPGITNLLYLARLNPFPLVDLTPFGYILTGWVVAWGLLRYRLFDIVPVARDKVIAGMDDGLIVLDQQGRIMDVNAAMCQLLNRPAGQVIGRPPDQILDRWPHLVERYRDVPNMREQIVLGEGERQRCFDLRISPLYSRPGRLAGRVVVLRDITAHKRVEEELRQVNDQLRQVNAALHQAQREMLAQQRALAALEERERLAGDLHDGLGQVLGFFNVQGQAVRDSIEQGNPALALPLLDRMIRVAQETLTDVRSYILGLRPTAAPTEGFVQDLGGFLQSLQQDYGFRTTVVLPEDCPPSLADPAIERQLLAIIREALTNVRRHAGVSSARLSLTLDSHGIQVIVADDGSGFEMVPPGPHFGLNIMRQRAVEVGGALQVNSLPGQGTQIVVWLPRHLSKTDLPAQRVLLVDDHPLFLEGLRNLLTARGMEVVGTATDGLEAREAALALRPDLILMDLHMPRCDGLEATRRIKSELPEVQVVLLTVSADQEHLFEALRSGASGYLLKNVDSEEFLTLLGEVVRGETTLSPDLAAQTLVELARLPAEPAQETTAAKEDPLTARQREVLEQVAEGRTYKEIAAAMHLTEATIKYHMRQILDRLHLQSRGEAIRYARKNGSGEEGRPD